MEVRSDVVHRRFECGNQVWLQRMGELSVRSVHNSVKYVVLYAVYHVDTQLN